MTGIVQLAVWLESRDDIWERDGQRVFPVYPMDGCVSSKALIFLNNPPPVCDADGIAIDINDTIEEIERRIRQRKGKP